MPDGTGVVFRPLLPAHGAQSRPFHLKYRLPDGEKSLLFRLSEARQYRRPAIQIKAVERKGNLLKTRRTTRLASRNGHNALKI